MSLEVCKSDLLDRALNSTYQMLLQARFRGFRGFRVEGLGFRGKGAEKLQAEQSPVATPLLRPPVQAEGRGAQVSG